MAPAWPSGLAMLPDAPIRNGPIPIRRDQAHVGQPVDDWADALVGRLVDGDWIAADEAREAELSFFLDSARRRHEGADLHDRVAWRKSLMRAFPDDHR